MPAITESFNPRAREGRDGNWQVFWRVLQVSIHAPARGATDGAANCHFGSSVSIHAPARGATASQNDFDAAFDVSIHAPARGATALC